MIIEMGLERKAWIWWYEIQQWANYGEIPPVSFESLLES